MVGNILIITYNLQIISSFSKIICALLIKKNQFKNYLNISFSYKKDLLKKKTFFKIIFKLKTCQNNLKYLKNKIINFLSFYNSSLELQAQLDIYI